jgi:hypothetical protein
MPNSDLSTDAYAEDEALVRPEDSASQRQRHVDPQLLFPPMGGSESWMYEEMIHTRDSEAAVTGRC